MLKVKLKKSVLRKGELLEVGKTYEFDEVTAKWLISQNWGDEVKERKTKEKKLNIKTK